MTRFPATLPIPEEVLSIARRLETAGFETWCVGGAVRDNLLGLENRDFDLATAAPPPEVQRLFRRTVPVGVEHGTVAVLDAGNRLHEVTTFRRDVKTDGRHAVVEFGVSLEEDLARRDFTINSTAYHPLRHDWRDPFDGRGDLDRQIIRAVGEPSQRFREDYLRILRAIRFAGRFGFSIDPGTWTAAVAAAEGLGRLSAERVRDEWFRSLATARRPSDIVRRWIDLGAAQIWLPEVRAVPEGVDHVEPRDPVLLTAMLSSDPGATLARLRCSNAEIDRARRIALLLDARPPRQSPVEIRRWMSQAGERVDDLVALTRAMHPAKGELLAQAVEQVRAAGAPLSVGQLAVSGDDLRAAGVPAGPELGAMLKGLLGLVLEDPTRNDRETLLQQVRQWMEQR